MMRIGIDGRSLVSQSPGGIGIYLSEVLRCIVDKPLDLEFFIYSHMPIARDFESGMIENIVLPGPAASLRFRYLLPLRLKRDEIDVFWGPAQFLPLPIAGVRYVMTVHDLAILINEQWANNEKEAFLEKLFCSRMIKDASVLLSVSCATAHDIKKLFPEAEGKVTIVHHGLNSLPSCSTAECELVLSRLNIRNRFFLYIGDLNKRKNVDTILKAFSILVERGSSSMLVMAGGNSKKKYNQYLSEVPNYVRSRIVCPGYVTNSEKSVLYQRAIAFVFPSRYEGFGLPVLEAMSVGGLVITSNTACLNEISGGVGMTLDNVENASELAEIMAYAETIPLDQREVLAKEGRRRAERFSWAECSDATIGAIVAEGKSVR